DKRIGRKLEVTRRRTFADATGGVVLRAVARAEPAAELALMRDRDAAEVGADADHDQPLVVTFLHARAVRLRIGQTGDRDALGVLDVFLLRWKMKIGFERQNTLVI